MIKAIEAHAERVKGRHWRYRVTYEGNLKLQEVHRQEYFRAALNIKMRQLRASRRPLSTRKGALR